MKIKLMRTLDITIGGVIFFVINALLFLKIKKPVPKIVPDQVKKILVIKD